MKLLVGLSFHLPKLNEKTILLVERSISASQLHVKFELKVSFLNSVASIVPYENL